MKLIFKISKYLPDTKQIVLKCCRQNAPKPIDEYKEFSLDIQNIDFTNSDNFKYSVVSNLVTIIKNQIEEEEVLPENQMEEELHSENLDDYIGKITGIDLEELISGSYIFKAVLT
jgi:hypothetical protein